VTADKPRILGAFNEPTSHWLSFFMFTMFTDRDGKYQLAALAESGFDPLARTCRFMLTEEAHHMFVGETGVQRVVKRACELIKADPNGDVRAQGGVDLPTVQKYLNLWYTLSLDLFGGEVSSNAADAFAAGLKGRYKEDRYDEHKLVGTHVRDGRARRRQGRAPRTSRCATRSTRCCVPSTSRTASAASIAGTRRSRKRASTSSSKLPSHKFHRQIGMWSTHRAHARRQADRSAPSSMPAAATPGCRATPTRSTSSRPDAPVYERGKMASWVAPPIKGINGLPGEFEYVRLGA
jgi:benzoyl-CoA 2,3-dioxygenase component B